MYQSPVAALAELISNAWDADAEIVQLSLPDNINSTDKIIIKDDGDGMTWEECQSRYLNVGYGRRGNDPDQKSRGKKRSVLGRKGIGKFAGFGIAESIKVETISRETGERTVFEMDLSTLRTQDYVEKEGGEVKLIAYEPPDKTRTKNHGTVVTLGKLTLSRVISPGQFSESMARRFLLHKRAVDFKVEVNGTPLPDSDELAGVEFVFPRDYDAAEKPVDLTEKDGWGHEKLPDGRVIRWRVCFFEETIGIEELRGVSVFAKMKLAQLPFFFLLSGGLGGQHGQQYMSGQIEADYLDSFDTDLISPERQRINWERAECQSLLVWGQDRVKELLRIWKERRATKKQQILTEKVGTFAERLSLLPKHEASTVRRALAKLATVPSLKDSQFIEIGSAILTAWESGRLKDLIEYVADSSEMGEEQLLDVLLEMNVLTALQTAEAVRAKLDVIAGLNERIKKGELENSIRDYVATHPWLIDPEWETFIKETRVKGVIEAAAREVKLDEFEDWKRRIDLVLSSGNTLLIVEFIRPGKPVDYDHLSRFSFYLNAVRSNLKAHSGHGFTRVIGYLVSDKLAKSATITETLEEFRQQEKYALDWQGLLLRAAARWREFLKILIERAPADTRLRALAKDLDLS